MVAIGGSAAHGWDDEKRYGGYLQRAFRAIPAVTHQSFTFVNASVVGAGPKWFVTRLQPILNRLHPDLVVISFGLLDDLDKHTPWTQLNEAFATDISLALKSHAKVLVVTPPVTGATYVEFPNQEGPLIQQQIAIARRYDPKRVHVVDLFSQMKAYLAAHNQTWHMYAADGWHPNLLGHKLGGTLLASDLEQDGWVAKAFPVSSN